MLRVECCLLDVLLHTVAEGGYLLADFNVLENEWYPLSDIGDGAWSPELALARGAGVELAAHDLLANHIPVDHLLLLLVVIE
jgi:hypothetical protein